MTTRLSGHHRAAATSCAGLFVVVAAVALSACGDGGATTTVTEQETVTVEPTAPPDQTTVPPGETTTTGGDTIAAAEQAAYAALEQEGAAPDESQTITLRSTRDPDWALVDGFTSDNRPWASWLQAEGGGWSVRHIAVQDGGSKDVFSPPITVPCDIEPAFSEPLCGPAGQ